LEHISYTKYGMIGFERGLVDLPEVSSKVKELAEWIYFKLVSRNPKGAKHSLRN